MTAFLGLGDDLFDIRWRHKWWIPGFACIPILVVYFVDFAVTSIVIPVPLRPYLGDLLDLGFLYYVYMACVAMFCPQSINMLAGINGIEVGQCVVISLVIGFNDILYLLTPYPHPATDSHLFSLYLLLPWIGVSLALLYHNWYPAHVFVGDTYCYVSGMVFAVVGILGHFSKTLFLLLVPQLFNFLYSTPQVFGLIPCPRHRLPRFNTRTGLLEPSVTTWTADHQPRPPVAMALHFLASLRLVKLNLLPAEQAVTLTNGTHDHTSNHNGNQPQNNNTNNDDNDSHETGGRQQPIILACSNLTLLNLWLVWRGPLREDRLAKEVMCLQFVIGMMGLFIRHRLALLIFKEDNLGQTHR